MTVAKRNKGIARWIVVLGSAVAGLGIWTAVANSPQPAASASPQITVQTPVAPVNPNFGSNDSFLGAPSISQPSQPYVQTPQAPSIPATQPVARPRLRTRGS